MNTNLASKANLLGLDYRLEAKKLGNPCTKIIDIHSHIHGPLSAKVMLEVMDLFGIEIAYSMTHWANVPAVQDVMGSRVRFIAIPPNDVPASDARKEPFLRRIEEFFRAGSRIVKFWCAPRGIDMARAAGDPNLLRVNAPHTKQAMRLAQELGMRIMIHIADPDVWFATRYLNTEIYRTKLAHYADLEEVLKEFEGPFILAHLGGYPEDLVFLANLLKRYPHVYLDASATKWVVRELGRHPPAEVKAFCTEWKERILFGSDIVAMDQHLSAQGKLDDKSAQASSPEEAFELYASRYWALRTMWESSYAGRSPIFDEDAAHTGKSDSVHLQGVTLPGEVLERIYRGNCAALGV